MNSSPEHIEEKCEYRKNLEILREHVYFSGVELERIKVIALICERKIFQEGSFIFHQNDMGKRAYHLISGRIEVIRDDDGKEVTLGEMKPGTPFGTLALFMPVKRLFSLRARSNVTCLTLDRQKFQGQTSADSKVIQPLFKNLVREIVNWEEHYLIHDVCRAHRTIDEIGVSLL